MLKYHCQAFAFPEANYDASNMMGAEVPTMGYQEETQQIPELSAANTDRSVYDPRPSATPAQFDQQSIQQAISSGQKEVFDTAIIGSMLKARRDDTMVDRYLPDMIKGMDRKAPVLFNSLRQQRQVRRAQSRVELELGSEYLSPYWRRRCSSRHHYAQQRCCSLDRKADRACIASASPDGRNSPSEATRPTTGSSDRSGKGTLASADVITIVKQIGLVSPVRQQRPEQPEADNETNYKFAGQTGEGPAPTISGGPAADGDHPSLQRVAGLLDFHAYLFNYAGVHPFHWHGKDWGLAQESELEWTEGKSLHGEAFKYSELASKMILPPPAPLKIKVDHRYGEQDYYQTASGIDFLPDGSVVLYDGWGSELVMTVLPPLLAGVWFMLPHWLPVTCFLIVLWLVFKTATTLERMGRPMKQIDSEPKP